MSGVDINKEAAAAPTADGPEDVKANLTVIDNTDDQITPDEPQHDAASIDGAHLLDRVQAFLLRFLCLPSSAANTIIPLWAAHTHFMDVWETTPRLAFLSAEPGSGKSMAMRITALLCPRTLEVASASVASLIRAMEVPEGRPTFFLDEIDTKYGSKAKGDEDLRGFINAGHDLDGFILRNNYVDDIWQPVKISVFAAICMAGIGDILPDTILTRSIALKMRKRLPSESVESYRRRDHKPIGRTLRDELAKWADQERNRAKALRPILPDEIADRDADVWEPLIAVADLAGGRWPALARQAAVEMLQLAKARKRPSLGGQLLAAIRVCFGDKDRLATAELLAKLLADEEAPWRDLGRKKLDARILAEMLAEFDIGPVGIRVSKNSTVRGYKREAFKEAWDRYLPSSVANATSATDATGDENVYETITYGVADSAGSSECGGDGEIVAEPKE